MSLDLKISTNRNISTKEIINLYETQRPFFSKPLREGKAKMVNSIIDIADEFDAFILDSYGVLNVGGKIINGVFEVLKELRSKNKILIVLTNGSSYPTLKKVNLLKSWGLPLNETHVLSSRDLLKLYISKHQEKIWGVIGSPDSDLKELGVNGYILGQKMDFAKDCQGFIYLGCEFWNDINQKILENHLKNKKTTVLVGNPDIIAPQKTGFSLEPGFWSLRFRKSKFIEIEYFGKPHLDIYKMAINQIYKLANKRINLNRIVMIGDSLHTDILGGLSAQISTVLVTEHGLFKNYDYINAIKKTKISPDWIIPSL